MLKFKEDWTAWYKNSRSQLVCKFDPADVLRGGPAAIPAEIRHGPIHGEPVYYQEEGDEDIEDEDENEDNPVGLFGKPARWLVKLMSGYIRTYDPLLPREAFTHSYHS